MIKGKQNKETINDQKETEHKDYSSIWGQLKPHLRGCYEGVPEVIACAGATGSCITGNDVTGCREPEMKGR
jgi:hypothetical protein